MREKGIGVYFAVLLLVLAFGVYSFSKSSADVQITGFSTEGVEFEESYSDGSFVRLSNPYGMAFSLIVFVAILSLLFRRVKLN